MEINFLNKGFPRKGQILPAPGRNVTVGDKEGEQLSPQVTDEGAGQQHFALNTPHPALRATFPPRGEGFCSGLSCKS